MHKSQSTTISSSSVTVNRDRVRTSFALNTTPFDLQPNNFTFWTSLLLSPKFGLRPKISQKVKSSAERFTKSKLRTEQSLNPKLINSKVDFACTRWVNQLEIKF